MYANSSYRRHPPAFPLEIIAICTYYLLDKQAKSTYIKAIEYEWNIAKNEAKHGVAFEAVQGFDWATALTLEDTRRAYGEARYISHGLIGDRLHVLVHTARAGRCRVIGLRKANARERKHYG